MRRDADGSVALIRLGWKIRKIAPSLQPWVVVLLLARHPAGFWIEVTCDMNRATSSTPCVDALAERQKWIAFASRLLSLCVEILGGSDVQVTEKEFADPKILALALLARTYMNLKGVIAVAREGLAVEARTLARACFENLFFIPNLIERGDEFVTAMYDHERRGVRSQGEFLLEDLDNLDPFGAEMANQLRARLREIKDLRPKAKFLNVKEVASGTVIKRAYPVLQSTVWRRRPSHHPRLEAASGPNCGERRAGTRSGHQPYRERSRGCRHCEYRLQCRLGRMRGGQPDSRGDSGQPAFEWAVRGIRGNERDRKSSGFLVDAGKRACGRRSVHSGGNDRELIYGCRQNPQVGCWRRGPV